MCIGNINFVQILQIRKELAYKAWRAMYSSMGITMLRDTPKGYIAEAQFVNGIRTI